MELRHLRYFVAVAERLNFTAASKVLHVTQSTLSHQIKQLEDEIGCPLFDRSGRSVTLTREGAMVLPRFAQALADVDSALRAVREAAGGLTGELRILIGARAFGVGLLPESLSRFLTQNPSIKVIAEEVLSLSFLERFAVEEFDFGIGAAETAGPMLEFEPLYTEELGLVVSRNHPFARRKRVRLVELHRQPLAVTTVQDAARRVLNECLLSAGVEPKIVAEIGHVDSLYELARRSDIAIVAGQHIVQTEDVAFVPLIEPTPQRVLGLWRKAGQPQPLASRLFAEAIRSTIASAAADTARLPRIQPWKSPTARLLTH